MVPDTANTASKVLESRPPMLLTLYPPKTGRISRVFPKKPVSEVFSVQIRQSDAYISQLERTIPVVGRRSRYPSNDIRRSLHRMWAPWPTA